MSARGAGLALLACVSTAGASPPSVMDAFTAYGAGDPARCADVLLAIEAAGEPLPGGAALLPAECLSAAGRFDEAFAYLHRQVPQGRILFDELAGKSRPGLDALRQQPGWTALQAEARAQETTLAGKRDAPLREELLRRAEVDQDARRAVFRSDGTIDTRAQARMADVDRDNTTWLKQVLETAGWPDSEKVGVDGAQAAWMLVQHADHDPAFQRLALARMQPAVEAGRADRSHFALLTDRVRVADGQAQVYGTQFETGEDGVMRLRPVEDMGGLDARRAAMHLPPMADYRQMLREGYGREVD